MKKEYKIFGLLCLLLLLVVSCKSKEPSIPDSASLIEQAKQAAQQALSNITIPESEQQIVIPPQQQQQQQYDPNLINKDYVAPCKLQKYRGLNVYCKGKTYWGKQSTLLSWYVPYSLILLLLLIFFVYFIIKLWNSRG